MNISSSTCVNGKSCQPYEFRIGLLMTTSMPETILVSVDMGMPGKIWVRVLMNVTYAA
jgi:hypothetical protein